MHKYLLPGLLLLSCTSAQACEIWRDEELGIWRGNCNLADIRKDFMVSQSFLANYDHRLILKWPDLQIDKFKFFVSGRNIDISADVKNTGMGNAIASVIAVAATIANPLTGMQQGTTTHFAVPVPALALNTSQRVFIGTVTVPNNTQDWDLVLLGVVDPPTMTQPVRGSVTESDETNNSRNHACRWYGPNPDTSTGPCN